MYSVNKKIVAALPIFFAFLSTIAFGQLEIKVGVRQRVDNAVEVTKIGDRLYIDSKEALQTSSVGVFRIVTKADLSLVRFSVRDSNLETFKPHKASDDTYEIEKPGRWLIRASVVDFKNQISGEDEKLLEFDGGDKPGPGPGPNPDPGPKPPPSPISDVYGVGAIAYQFAPRDKIGAAKYSAIYKQAGDFLFGVPSLKFITSSNDAHDKDPNRSVRAWMLQQFGTIQCVDDATCKAWAAWRSKVDEAFRVSQTKRQYTRQDWFNALNEVMKALEAVK